MADNTLRVSTEMDVGPLVAGTATSAAALENLSAKFKEIAASAETAGQTIMAQAARFMAQGLSAKEAASGLEQLGYGAKEASTAVAAVGSAAGIAAPALETVAKTATGAGIGMQQAAFAGAQVRAELGALTGSIGGVEYGLARVASRMPELIPLIEAAFAPLLLVAFAEIVGSVIEKIDKMTEAMAGYTEQVKKAEKADEEFSTKALGSAVSVGEAQGKLNTIVTESRRVAQESYGQEFTTAFQDATHAAMTHEGVLASLRDAFVMTAKDPLAPFEALTGTIKGLYNAEGTAADYAIKLRNAQNELLAILPKLNVELDNQALKLVEAREASEKAGLTGFSGRVAQIQIELNALRDKQRLEEDIARTESAAKGGAGADQAAAVAAVAQEYEFKRIQITKELDEAVREEAQNEIVEGEKILTFQTDMARRKEEIAAQDKSRIAEEQIERERAADKDAADALKVVTAHVDAQREMAVESAKAAETAGLANIAAQEKDLAFTKQMGSLKLESSMAGGLAKISIMESLDAQELEQQKKLEDEKLRIIKESLDKQRVALTHAAVGSQAETQFLIVNPEAAKKFQEYANEEARAVQERNNKIKILDQQLELNEQQVANKMAEAFVKAFAQINQAASRLVGEMLTSNQKISVDFAKTGQQMLVSMAQSLAQQLLKKAETEAAIHIIEQSSVLQSIATFLSGNAAKQVAAHTMAESIIAMDAGMAAAGAFADAFIATPLPVALAAAPAAAAAAASGTEAAGAAAAFQKGGLTTEAGPAMLHAKEMVLPESISTGLQTMIARGGVGGVTQNSRRQNIEVHIHGGTNMTHSDIIKAVKVGIRRGELPVPG